MTKNPAVHKKDPSYKQAKKRGYRARSALKLLDIQRKFNIFKRAFYVLDLGSVPGSWLQVSQEIVEENIEKYKDEQFYRDQGKIMGVDIKKISPLENIKTIKMDFTKPEFQNEINSYFEDKVDLILSDASINKSGIKFSDHINQIKLCKEVLRITKKNLKKGGNFVIKTFTGEDFNQFLKSVKKMFGSAITYTPKATKKGSNETYVIGLNKKD